MPSILLMIALLAAGNIETNAVCTRKLDLAFVIDGSSTVCGAQSCPNWASILQFIKNIVGSLTIGSNGTKVALYKLSDGPIVEWNFNKYQEKSLLLAAIDGVVYPGGEFTIASALSIAVSDYFSPAAGDRLGVPNVAIAISDGVLNININLVYGFATLVQFSGLTVFPVCVTPRCNENMVQVMASNPVQINETYFLVKDYSSLNFFTEKLVTKICAI